MSSDYFCREVVTLLDLAFHYGAPADKRAADMLQKRLLHDDSKDCGVLNRIVSSMKEFKRHDKKVAKQERRETREYGLDMAKTLHVVLRVYERLAKAAFAVKKRTRYHTEPGEGKVGGGGGKVGKGKGKAKRKGSGEKGSDDEDEGGGDDEGERGEGDNEDEEGGERDEGDSEGEAPGAQADGAKAGADGKGDDGNAVGDDDEVRSAFSCSV